MLAWKYTIKMLILSAIHVRISRRHMCTHVLRNLGKHSLEGEIWPFLKVPISPKPKRSHPPKLVYMYVTSILTCMIFLSRF